MRTTTLAWLAALAGALGCGPRGGSDVGNGASATLDVGTYKRTASAPGAITLESGATVTDFWISLGSFRLRGGQQCGAQDTGKLVFGGPIVANLARPDPAPGRSEPVPIDVGPHCRLGVNVEPVHAADMPGGAPDELEDAALFVRGARADGVPFSVRSTRVVDLRMDALGPEGFELEDGIPLVVAFDLEDAIRALDLDALDEPSIVIDDKTNMSRLVAFESRLLDGASLFEDDNADGILAEDESSPGKELAAGGPSGEP